MSEKKANTGESRYRSWACVVYPESAPETWQQIIAEWKVQAFVSPLHDKDIDPQNQPKKPHHHVMVMFEGKKSMEQMREMFAEIGGVGCEAVKSARGYARYLCHLDNPEKAQYDTETVMSFGGSDYNAVIGLPLDRYKVIADMVTFIDEQGLDSFSDLVRYAMNNKPSWFRALCDNSSYFIREYIKSVAWTRERDERFGV